MSERIEKLSRRARRLRKKGDFRKAANAFGELTSVEPNVARWWVLLGVVLRDSRRHEESRKALRQAQYLFRRAGELRRFETVRSLLVQWAEPLAA
jgi:Flp pilus assembly protein TadD